MDENIRFFEDFIKHFYERDQLSITPGDEQLLFRARKLLDLAKATQAKHAKLGKLMTAEELEESRQHFHCPKSPDGAHLFIFGRVSKKPIACEHCGTTVVTHGESFRAITTVPTVAE